MRGGRRLSRRAVRAVGRPRISRGTMLTGAPHGDKGLRSVLAQVERDLRSCVPHPHDKDTLPLQVEAISVLATVPDAAAEAGHAGPAGDDRAPVEAGRQHDPFSGPALALGGVDLPSRTVAGNAPNCAAKPRLDPEASGVPLQVLHDLRAAYIDRVVPRE